MRALIISGGGAFGAWGGGVAQKLFESNKDYKIIIGTSTGALLAPLVALNKYDILHEAYTSVSTDDIFNVNPFTKKGNINYLNALWRLITGEITLGESKNLRDLISDFFTEKQYEELKSLNKEVIVCVYNINLSRIEYKSNKYEIYEDFCDWMWISANAPIFMSLVKKNGYSYVDGGIIENAAVQLAVDYDYKYIDVILHKNKGKSLKADPKNIFQFMSNLLICMMEEISENDVNRNFSSLIEYNIYYMPYKLKVNLIKALNFNQKLMKEWWDIGLSTEI